MQKSITITLPEDIAQFLASEIANGQFASEEEAVVDALRSQAETSAFIASTLTPETIQAVRDAAAELDRNPSSAIPIEEIAAKFRKRRESIEKLTA